jgi:drug/metabolite transporter (DMT)-like permease
MKPAHYLMLIALAALWGGSFLCLRVAAPQFGPLALIELRVAIAALLLAPLLGMRQGFEGIGKNRRSLAVIGLLNSAVPFSLFAFASLYVTAGFNSILNATSPLFGALIAMLWLRERHSIIQVAGLAIGFGGVIVLVWGKASFSSGNAGLAVPAGLSAAALYGFCANYAKKKLAGVSSLALATGSQTAAAVFLFPPALWQRPAAIPEWDGWLSLFILAACCTSLAYIIYFHLIAKIGPTRTITVTYLIPVFGMFWGALFLNEPITLNMAVGCAVILFGSGMALQRRRPVLEGGR